MFRWGSRQQLNVVGSIPGVARSLADSFVVEVKETEWNFFPINEVVKEPGLADGTKASAALCEVDDVTLSEASASATFQTHCDDDHIEVKMTSTHDLDATFVGVMSRIMAQHTAKQMDVAVRKLTLPGQESCVSVNGLDSEVHVLRLFDDLIGDSKKTELVEMVDDTGRPLGMVPRGFVHTWNLLHCGIGMVIAKDGAILEPGYEGSFPDLYVHRRTDTKRVFPSLYDMFVGGVSTANESAELTAAREVAEELGLERALTDGLSKPLFVCTVCTAYNRCVVTMFCYTFDSTRDTVSWQEEEVAWGAFVDYATIEKSATLSIDRLLKTESWPGRTPADLNTRLASIDDDDNEGEWTTWDYVPDGLLVWEAWLDWQGRRGD